MLFRSIFTWLRYGKPDVSMTLNGSLAGLVAITAGCDTVSPFGAFFIGFVAGFLVVLSVEFFDNIAKVDDPVGAVSVHFANGVWGTIAVGLFSTGANTEHAGLFYRLANQIYDEVKRHFQELVFKTVIQRNVKLSDPCRQQRG